MISNTLETLTTALIYINLRKTITDKNRKSGIAKMSQSRSILAQPGNLKIKYYKWKEFLIPFDEDAENEAEDHTNEVIDEMTDKEVDNEEGVTLSQAEELQATIFNPENNIINMENEDSAVFLDNK